MSDVNLILLAYLIGVCWIGFALAQGDEMPNVDVCEPITGECSDQGYTHTRIEPWGHSSFSSQQAADAKIKSFDILTPCSKYLRIFLCAAYKPSCFAAEAENTLLVRPCRSLCDHVFARCYPLMEKFKRKWSPELNCSRFLDDSSQRCMNDPAGYERDPAPFDAGAEQVQQQIDLLFDRIVVTTSISSSTTPSSSSSVAQFDSTSSLPSVMVSSPTLSGSGVLLRRPKFQRRLICGPKHAYHHHHNLHHHDQSLERRNMSSNCAIRCDSSADFSAAQKQAARVLGFVLNLLACVISSMAALMFIVRRKLIANSFPVNCFFYSSIAILGHSLSQAIGFLIGIENMACEKFALKHFDESMSHLHHRPLVYSSRPFDNANCSMTFLAAYFFSTSLLARWLTIAFTWYWMVWRHQLDHRDRTCSQLGKYLNAFALVAPAIPTCILLVARRVEVSELSGLCTLGSLDADLMFKFVIFPSSVCLILGLLLILAGYRNILVMRIRHPDHEFSRLVSSKSVIRRGLWSFLGSIPILSILGCQLAEYVGLDEDQDNVNNNNNNNNNSYNKQALFKIGLFLVKNGMYLLNAIYVLVLISHSSSETCPSKSLLFVSKTAEVNNRNAKKSSAGVTACNHRDHQDSNETSDTLNTSSSFERKLGSSSPSQLDLFAQSTGGTTTTITTTTNNHKNNKKSTIISSRPKCACHEYRLQRSMMMSGAQRSMTLSESFIRVPSSAAETPLNEHHYCTPNLMAYQTSVIGGGGSGSGGKAIRPNQLVTACKFAPMKLDQTVVASGSIGKMTRNFSMHNAKFV